MIHEKTVSVKNAPPGKVLGDGAGDKEPSPVSLLSPSYVGKK